MNLLFYVLLISILICIYFLVKGLFFVKNKSQSFKIFLGFNALFGLLVAGLYLYTIELDENNQFLNLYSLLFFVFCISLPPTFFLYIKSLTQSLTDRVSINDIAKHYYPALLLLVINSFAFVFLNLKKEDSDLFLDVQNIMNYANLLALFFVFLFQVVLYLFLSIVVYRKYSQDFEDLYSYDEGVSLSWIISSIAGFFIFIISFYLVQIGVPQGNLLFGTSVLVYMIFINHNAFKQEYIYSNLTNTSLQSNIDSQEDKIETPVFDKENRIEKEKDWSTALIQKLEKAMLVDKIYKDTNLNLFQLSTYLDTNTKYLSQTINNHYKKNFSSYINEYRIIESIEILSGKEQEQYTLEHIANLSGFKSRSAFIASFKKMKNMTPSQYKNTLNFNNYSID